MEDLLDDIREHFTREVFQFTLHLEYLIEQGAVTLEELEEAVVVTHMFMGFLSERDY